MIFGKSTLELKIGTFVFIGVVILVTFVLLIGDFKTWTSGFKVNFIFNFVNGVKIGAPVRFAGVDVGEVKNINFIFLPAGQKTKVRVVCWLKQEVKVPADSTVWVNTLGLLGEKYIEIMPGKDYKNFLVEEQTLVGVDPIPMHEVTVLAKNIAAHLDESIIKIRNGEGTIGKLLYSDTLYKELETAIKNRNGTIGRFIYDDSLYRQLEDLVADLKQHPWKLLWKPKEKPGKK